jgi:hypothetical protein
MTSKFSAGSKFSTGSSKFSEQQLVAFKPREPIDPNVTYLVDMFHRDWSKVIDVYTRFQPGGTHFIVKGFNLKFMMNKCPTFDEQQETEQRKYKRQDVCFKGMKRRDDVANKYQAIFYRNTEVNTWPDFQALRSRPRNKRFANRLKFTFKVVKSLKCDQCPGNECVYDALKLFYNNDKKCADEVDRLVSKQ